MGFECSLVVLKTMLKSNSKERSVYKKLKRQVEKEGGICKKVEWHETGYPDDFVVNKYGAVWLVETKRPKKGELSARQILVHRDLRKINVKVRLVLDDDTLDIFMNEFRNTK